MRNFEARLRRLELSTTAAVPMISGSEVASVIADFHRKLGLRYQPEHDSKPISYKAIEKAGARARKKLQSFLAIRKGESA
jgi:hypothetical protein